MHKPICSCENLGEPAYCTNVLSILTGVPAGLVPRYPKNVT